MRIKNNAGGASEVICLKKGDDSEEYFHGQQQEIAYTKVAGTIISQSHARKSFMDFRQQRRQEKISHRIVMAASSHSNRSIIALRRRQDGVVTAVRWLFYRTAMTT